MAEAVFLVDVEAGSEKIRQAITTVDGVASWWTTDVSRDADLMSLGFPDAPAPFSIRVDSEDDERIQWTSTGKFPPHWENTQIVWNLMDNPDTDGSRLFFEHKGFAAPDPMLGHTAFTWANLMNSLKRHCESGDADPFFDL